jgi:hypothetical protein
MNVESIVQALDGKRSGDGWRALCPAHDDTITPSLSIKECDDGTILVHCFAGCKQEQVIDALRDLGLWDQSTSSVRRDRDPFPGLSAEEKRELGVLPVTLFDEEGKRKSQSTLLVELGNQCKLFHDSEGAGYAVTTVDTHYECWKLRTKGFKEWLRKKFFELTSKGCSSKALQDAVETLEAKAKYDNEERKVHIRPTLPPQFAHFWT